VKSNASYVAWQRAQEAVRGRGPLAVPIHLRNAPTALLKSMGHGADYRYPHDEGGHAAGQTYLPDELAGARFYEPRNAGFEIKLRDRLARLRGPEDPTNGGGSTGR
jgi:putative ATPase